MEALINPSLFLFTTFSKAILSSVKKNIFQPINLFQPLWEAARKIKPTISITGYYDIPLRHEIELEYEP
jgi:hypothetical protein